MVLHFSLDIRVLFIFYLFIMVDTRLIPWKSNDQFRFNWQKGSFTNYVDKILAFLTTYPPLLTFPTLWTMTKSGHFWTTYSSPLVNVVCERPSPVSLSFKISCEIYECIFSEAFLIKYTPNICAYLLTWIRKKCFKELRQCMSLEIGGLENIVNRYYSNLIEL